MKFTATFLAGGTLHCPEIRMCCVVRIDFLLCPGDFLRLKSEDNDYPERLKAGEEEISDFFKELQAIHPTVYYIPGNVS